MQAWLSHGQCIFCQYRLSLRQAGRQQCESRLLYTTSTSRSDRRRERNDIREKGSIIRRVGKKPPASSEHGSIRPATTTRPAVPQAAAIDAVFENRIRSRLENIRSRLEDSSLEGKDSDAMNLSWLKKLDPDGHAWKYVEETVEQSIENKGLRTVQQPTNKRLGLHQQLSQACMVDFWRSAVDRVLIFAYSNHVIDSQENTSLSSNRFDLRHPTEWYQDARAIQRQIHLHVGPTNSGKTYNALKRLEEAGNGFYAGPLRLLAHEVYSRFNNRNIKCDLVTGDDVRLCEGENIGMYSSTIEMVDLHRDVEVGVIDEIQMINSEDRGWAWTRALLGARAKELHLCGEARVVPLVRELVASMGDTLHIHHYERLNPLKVMSRSLRGDLKNLRKGDCVVSFSIVGIHALKRQIEIDTGKRVAIVYGSLPPETRAQQAALFNDPDNNYDFLVASDAVGMGLNLSIKRVVFETTMKFTGKSHERLSISQLKQIAGRAGRYRTARNDQDVADATDKGQTPTNVGLVTCLDEADLPYIQQAMNTEAPPIKQAGLLPPGEVHEDMVSRLPEGVPFEFVVQRVTELASVNSRYKVCDIKDQLMIARQLDEVRGLSVAARLIFGSSPGSWKYRGQHNPELIKALGRIVTESRVVTVADMPEIPLEILDKDMSADRTYLEDLEHLHKSLILYLWLSYRFQHSFRDQDMATRAKELCEEKINITLAKFSANPKLRERLLGMKKSSALLQEQADKLGIKPEYMTPTLNPDQITEHVQDSDSEGDISEDMNSETVRDDQTDHLLDRSSGVEEPTMVPEEEQVIDDIRHKEAASG